MKTYFRLLDTAKQERKTFPRILLKLEMFEVLTDYNYYIELLKRQETNQWSLSTEFVNAIYDALTFNSEEIRNIALNLLRTHLTKFDFDKRYQENRSFLCNLYFPYIEKILNDVTIIQSFTSQNSLNDFIVTFLYILYNSTRKFTSNVSSLVEILTCAVIIMRVRNI